MFIGLLPSGDLFDRPGERRPQGLFEHRPTGFADGHQPMERPFLRTALLQLAHEQTVRQHDQVHVPGLALGITQLTITQPESPTVDTLFMICDALGVSASEVIGRVEAARRRQSRR